MFGYVMENELENNLLMFYFFFKFITITRNKSYKFKKLNGNEIEKKYNFINYLK